MGLASSQARMLLLTARKSDLEYRAQMISQRKINLAMQTQALATKYSEALQNRTMKLAYATVDGVTQYEKLSYAGLTAENPHYVGDFIVKTASGKYAVTDVVDALKLAAKLENVNNTTVEPQPVLKFKPTPVTVDPIDVTYEAITKTNNNDQNDESSDFVVLTNQGKYAVTDQNDALRIAVKVSGKDVNIDKLSENEKAEYLKSINYEIIPGMNQMSDFQAAVTNGSLILAKSSISDDGKKSYTPVAYDKFADANISSVTEDRFKYSNVDLSSMTDNEKQVLLNKYKGQMVIVSEMNNPDYFQDALRNGGLFLQKLATTSGKDENGNTKDFAIGYENIAWGSCTVISDDLNREDDAQAQADYESQTLVLSNQDKMLDLELNQVETQHKAIETEYDSVKKVIQKNIDVSYKIFA